MFTGGSRVGFGGDCPVCVFVGARLCESVGTGICEGNGGALGGSRGLGGSTCRGS